MAEGECFAHLLRLSLILSILFILSKCISPVAKGNPVGGEQTPTFRAFSMRPVHAIRLASTGGWVSGSLLAADALGLDLATSWVVGDSDRDIEMGRRAGLRTLRVTWGKPCAIDADATIPAVGDLAGALERLL